jgi:hypothetical protein
MRVGFPDVDYLGHKVVPSGTAPMTVKVEAIVKMLPPTDVSELRAVLGTANYYRKFVENYSTIAAPLNNLLREDVVWNWTKECQQAFDTIKEKLTQALILRRPDYSRPFELHTDWSGVGLGVVLVQRDNQGREYVIAYASRSNNRTERNYSSYAGECLAAVWGLSHFRVYLYGRRFVLLTDHEPLKWLMTNKKLTGMHARWAHILSEYDFEIKHRPGKRSEDADGLLRNPLQVETELTDTRMDHEPSSVSPISLSAGLALLAYQGADISKIDKNQSSIKEDFALAIPEKDAPFSGTEKDGELVLQNPRINPVSRHVRLDPGTLWYLRDKTFEEGASAQERDRVQHRAKGYYFMNKLLRKRTSPLTGKIDKVVPPPRERTNLICAIHIEAGHFGVHKTHFLLEPTYFWSGMFAQVRKEVSSCTVRDRVKTNFEDPALKPLPIMGMFYRWGVDLCKMPFKSASGSRYVVVMIGHFSKWIELVPIPDKTSHHSAAALREVLCRYGAPAEVLTDQGKEFQGEFAELLTKLLIDHPSYIQGPSAVRRAGGTNGSNR